MSGMLESTKQRIAYGGLVLTRSVDESITIGDEIEVMVIEISGNKTRLLITAPKQLPVNRKEIADRDDFHGGAKRKGDGLGRLVLSRWPGQAVAIGEEVVVVVERVLGSKVRLRTQAPMSMKVMRKELVRS